jgi:hypothetical protein
VQSQNQAALANQQAQLAAAAQNLQAQQAAGGLAATGQQLQQAGAGQQLGGLGNLYNLGIAPSQAAFSPLTQLAGIIGGPTVLSTGLGQNQASSYAQSTGSSVGATPSFLTQLSGALQAGAGFV